MDVNSQMMDRIDVPMIAILLPTLKFGQTIWAVTIKIHGSNLHKDMIQFFLTYDIDIIYLHVRISQKIKKKVTDPFANGHCLVPSSESFSRDELMIDKERQQI